MVYTYTSNGILLGHERVEILPFLATQMNTILNEISQKEKNNTPYESAYIANLKNVTNKRETEPQIQTAGCQEGSGWKDEIRGAKYKLPAIR